MATNTLVICKSTPIIPISSTAEYIMLDHILNNTTNTSTKANYIIIDNDDIHEELQSLYSSTDSTDYAKFITFVKFVANHIDMKNFIIIFNKISSYMVQMYNMFNKNNNCNIKAISILKQYGFICSVQVDIEEKLKNIEDMWITSLKQSNSARTLVICKSMPRAPSSYTAEHITLDHILNNTTNTSTKANYIIIDNDDIHEELQSLYSSTDSTDYAKFITFVKFVANHIDMKNFIIIFNKISSYMVQMYNMFNKNNNCNIKAISILKQYGFICSVQVDIEEKLKNIEDMWITPLKQSNSARTLVSTDSHSSTPYFAEEQQLFTNKQLECVILEDKVNKLIQKEMES
uniref:Uncharacterized protein n=1 Tax=viral metagenome TaxID=1070528 RepID=A0A6C0I0C5_9ZZZZ